MTWRLQQREFTTEWGQTLVAERVYATKEEAIENGYKYTFTVDGWDVYESVQVIDEPKYVLVELNKRYVVKGLNNRGILMTSSEFRFRKNAEHYIESHLASIGSENARLDKYHQYKVKYWIEEVEA